MFELKRQLNCRVEIKEWISHLFSSKMQNAVLHNISANNQNSASSLRFLWENYRFWGGLNICMCINSTAAVLHICSRFRSNFLQINYCTRLQSLSPTLEVIFSLLLKLLIFCIFQWEHWYLSCLVQKYFFLVNFNWF